MSEKTCKTVRFWSSVALAVMTVITAALFIWQSLDIYLSGVAAGKTIIYTQEDAFARIKRISPAFWIWVVMIIGCFVVWEVFPVKSKVGAYNDTRYILARFKKRIPASVGEELSQSFDFVKREEENLKILWRICAVIGAAGIIYSIAYLANPLHFPKEDVTGEVLNMVKNVLPWAAAAFAVACGISIYEGISAKRQLEHAKTLARGNKPLTEVHGKVYEVLHHKYFILGLRIATGCFAVAFIIAGIVNGNMSGVLEKAIKICLECIGLG